MTSVLDHRKFSRGEAGYAGHTVSGDSNVIDQSPAAEVVPVFELMDPLPDHSDDVPESVSKPPTGVLEYPTVSTVSGESFEHYPSQHAAVNQQLMQQILDTNAATTSNHAATIASIVKHKESQHEVSAQLLSNLKEYTNGVAVHAASSSEAAKPNAATITNACGLVTKIAEVDDLTREEWTQDALKRCFATLCTLINGVDGDRQPLSKTARSEMQDCIALSYGEETTERLVQGIHLVGTDVFSYLRGELAESDAKTVSLMEAVSITKARLDASVLMEDTDEVDELSNTMLATLSELLAIQDTRLTAVRMAKGEAEEFEQELTTFREETGVHVRSRMKSVEATRKLLQADLRKVMTGRNVQKALSDDHSERFLERRTRLMQKIKDNNKKQEAVFAAVHAELLKLPHLQTEKVHLLQALAKDVEEDAMRIMHFNAWMDHNNAIKDRFEVCVARQSQLHASLQQVSQEALMTLRSAADDLCVSETMTEFKLSEGKNALDMHTHFATVCGESLSKKEARLAVLEAVNTKMNTTAAITGASGHAAATLGVTDEMAFLREHIARLSKLDAALRPSWSKVTSILDEAQYLHDNPYELADSKREAALKFALDSAPP